MPRLTHDQRNQAYGMIQAGMNSVQVARRFGCHKSTITRLMQRLETTGSVKDRPRPGQPRKTSAQDDRSIRLRVLRNRRSTGVTLQRELRRTRGVWVSDRTIRRRITASGLRSHRPFRGIVLTPNHRRLRLQWCRQHRRLTLAQWNKVLVSDECRFLLQKVDGRERVWRRRGERHADACTTETDRFGGGVSVMVWAGITGSHRTDLVVVQGNLTAARYRDEILQQHVVPFMRQHPETTTFQQDNARPHTARISMEFLQQNDIQVLPWPAKSPDLSPIENLWGLLKNKLRQLDNPPSTAQELTTFLQREWQDFPQATIRGLFNSMRRRCTKCITAQGGHIDY